MKNINISNLSIQDLNQIKGGSDNQNRNQAERAFAIVEDNVMLQAQVIEVIFPNL